MFFSLFIFIFRMNNKENGISTLLRGNRDFMLKFIEALNLNNRISRGYSAFDNNLVFFSILANDIQRKCENRLTTL